MTLELYSKSFTNIPVGLSYELRKTIELAGDITQVIYSNSLDFNHSLRNTTVEPDENWDMVNLQVVFYIDEDLTYMFNIYLDKLCEKYKADLRQLKAIWSLKNND